MTFITTLPSTAFSNKNKVDIFNEQSKKILEDTDIKGVVSDENNVHRVSRTFLLSEQRDAGNDYFGGPGQASR